MALTLAKTATKLAIGVGAVYATVDQGVWNSSNSGSKALDKVRTKVLPTANEYYTKVADTDAVNRTVTNTWNSGVQTVFRGIAAAPAVVEEYSDKAVTQLKSSLKS